MNGVLDNIKVLDLGSQIAGPVVSVYLSDFGANVIKVEPFDGDPSRSLYTTPFLGAESRMFMASNRGKRGICIDITKENGKEIIYRLIKNSDILLENFKPGVMERLGFDYETVRNINPELIYVSINAFGEAGPFAGQPGYDRLIQALTGIMGARRMPDGAPISTPAFFVDNATAMYTAFGIALALLWRNKTGKGQRIRNSLLGMGIALQSAELVYVANDTAKETPSRYEATWEAFRCKDGGYLLSVVANNREWARLCKALALDNLIEDPMFKNAPDRTQNSRELRTILESMYATKNRDDWTKLLSREGCAYAPVLDRAEVFNHEQMKDGDVFVELEHPKVGAVKMMGLPLKLSEAPATVKRPPPLLGQHTKEILQNIGYTAAEIERLKQDKVVK